MEEHQDGKGTMWELDQTLDQPLGDEATQVRGFQNSKEHPLAVTIRLAFISLGVVYGDLATSPLYVFPSVFPDGIVDRRDVLGAVCLIVYSFTLIPLIKYVFIVLRANDNGEGGTFALYSLICRHAKVNTIPNQHPTDQYLTTYSRRPVPENSRASTIKKLLEGRNSLQKLLLVLVLLGTSMVIGDGVLTPAISVLSSVSGIKVAHPSFHQGHVVILALIILVLLFSMQHVGTDKVGVMFGPVILVWLLSIGAVGVYNIAIHKPDIFRALSPVAGFDFLRRTKSKGWARLGGIVLSITGAEAMFADLGHFSTVSIRLAFTSLVFPCLLAAYLGQASFLLKFPDKVDQTFYRSIPDPVYWPMFVIATVAAIVASQATISATFSIVKQSVALGCFPRVKIIHTSNRILGQIYVPEVNWILMLLCLAITAGFRETTQIGNAYGIAVMAVMLVTTLLMTLIMLFIWQTNLSLVLLFLVTFGSVETIYFSAVLFKIAKGGWVPLAIAAALMLIFYAWHYGTVKRYQFEIQNKVPLAWILGLGPSLGLVRVPGVGFVYTDLAHGVPSMFSHFITHLPAIHSVLVFVCVKYLPVNTVLEDERFLFRRIGPPDYWMYRCTVRYGYRDLHRRDEQFEERLIGALADFIRKDDDNNRVETSSTAPSEPMTMAASDREQSLPSAISPSDRRFSFSYNSNEEASCCSVEIRRVMGDQSGTSSYNSRDYQVVLSQRRIEHQVVEDQLKFLVAAKESGVVHILGNTVVKARKGSGLAKRIAINHVYSFLRKVCRETSVIYHIPHETMLNVGMIYDV
ncbi:probable potassium transporter 11 isoform X2 [Selaginella moellendorffii]|uniref:probable potassium transporter 11 isoform X2 n=1 Tax=Selaginella moellendorffii TaxID=88036 RepID=UPI000D1C26A4|nr:probable potassium transporter 11 isoform X2 [Selaginella moellendorffii]|eukprot:XP_024525103.1 probable potassium transporter 11 isoform X2 [Selaginella moellendorffii]